MTEDTRAYMEDLNLVFEEGFSDENITSTIDLKTEYPHLILKTEDVLKTIKIISPIINLKSNRNIPKSLTFYYDEGKYKYLITDDVSYFNQDMDILNTDNRLEETLCIPLNILQACSKSFGEHILIYKKENNFYVRLTSGDLILDLVKAEENLLKYPGVVGNELMYTSTNSLSDALKSILPIVQCEPTPEKKKITFVNDTMEFNTGKFLISYDIKLPTMKISFRTAEFLKSLCGVVESALYFYEDTDNQNRIHIKCEDVTYTTTVGKDSIDPRISAFIESKYKDQGIIVEYLDFNSVITLASSLNYATGSVLFNIVNQDCLITTIPNTKGNSSFSVYKKKNTNMFNANNNRVEVLSKSLKKLLGSFPVNDLYVVLNTDSVAIKSGPIKGVLLK